MAITTAILIIPMINMPAKALKMGRFGVSGTVDGEGEAVVTGDAEGVGVSPFGVADGRGVGVGVEACEDPKT